MSTQIQVSRQEKIILSIIGTVLVGLIAVLVLINAIEKNIGMALVNPGLVEIAVLVPDKDETPGKEIIEVAILGADKASAELKAAGKTQRIAIHIYETGDNPNSAAWAATMALRNSNTIAVIGPFDARQSIAVAEILHGKGLVMLTTDGLAPLISPKNSALDTVFHLSLPFTEQARRMVTFLNKQGWNDVYIVAEQTTYAQKVLEIFNSSANQIINVVGAVNLTDATVQEIIPHLTDLQPKALFYIGNPEKAITLLSEMNQARLQIPFVGIDTLSEPSFLSSYTGTIPVYYSSSLFNLQAVPEEDISDQYRTILTGRLDAPYAAETLEAIWFIFNALDNNQAGETMRERVWYGMNQSYAFVWNGETAGFTNHWRTPRHVFFYELNQDHPQPSLFLTMEQ